MYLSSRSGRRTCVVRARTSTYFLSIFPFSFFLFFFFIAIVTISRAQLDVALLYRSTIECTYNSLVEKKSHFVDKIQLLTVTIQINYFSLEMRPKVTFVNNCLSFQNACARLYLIENNTINILNTEIMCAILFRNPYRH